MGLGVSKVDWSTTFDLVCKGKTQSAGEVLCYIVQVIREREGERDLGKEVERDGGREGERERERGREGKRDSER